MNKKTLILGAVLIILIALAYGYQGPLKKWQNNLGKPKNILANIDTARIDKLEIISGNTTVILSKQGDAWKYENNKDFYADPALVSGALNSLKIASKAPVDLISDNQDRKSEFKTDSSGIAVKAYQAGKLTADFIIGSASEDYSSSYISAPSLASTYLVKSDLASAFNQTEWRDLTIFSSDKSKINKVRFQYPNREFTVELKNGKWIGTIPNSFAVSQEKIDKILDLMSNLKAAAIPEQSFENTGLEKHLIIIQATGEGVDNTLMIGEAQGALYYAKSGESDNIYLIEKSQRDELNKWSYQLK